jgi:glycosyltransferase involved in cell wall biosynthesis
MHVAVAPYPELEQFYFSPLKIYEYMACGLPVITSQIGQLPRLVRENETGLLYPPGDAAALAVKIGMIYRDPQMRARLGRDGRELVLRQHSWDAVIKRIIALAEESTTHAERAL